MRRAWLILWMLGGCAEPTPAPPTTAEIPPVPSAPSAAPADSVPSAPSAAPDAGPSGKWEPGSTVTAIGRISKTPSQHLVGNVEGKQPEYFDIEGRAQAIVHVAKPIACPGLVSVTGKVFAVRGSSKPGSKVDDGWYSSMSPSYSSAWTSIGALSTIGRDSTRAR